MIFFYFTSLHFKCIYTVHHRYYCFSGKGHDLTPYEMYPVYKKKTSETDMQDVFTGPYGTSSGLGITGKE